MDMGSITLFRRGVAIRGSNDTIGNRVQTPWCFQYRYCPIHILALSAMGHKTILEPDS